MKERGRNSKKMRRERKSGRVKESSGVRAARSLADDGEMAGCLLVTNV